MEKFRTNLKSTVLFERCSI